MLGVFSAMLGIGLVIGLALGVVVAKRRGSAAGQLASTTGSGSGSAASSQSPAMGAFAEAMAAQRAADPGAMHAALNRSVALDPGFAPAHLHLGLSQLTGDPRGARPHLDAAAKHADRLSDREKKLLGAVQPCVQAESGDMAPCLGRIRTLLAGDFATDPFLHALAGWLLLRTGEPGEGLAVATRGIELDPRFAFGWLTRGALEAFLGRYDDALASFEACSKQAPGATACLRAKFHVHSHLGEQDACERTARLLVDRSPEDATSALILADALAAKRRPAPEIDAAIARAIELAPAEEQAALRARLAGALAARQGSLAAAAAKYEVALAASETGADPRRTRTTLWPLLEILHELEKDERAARITQDIEKSAKADGVAPLDADPYAPLLHATPILVHARYRAKVVDADGRRDALETFENARAGQTPRALGPFFWLATWGATVETKADAEDAFIRLRAAHLALPTYAPGVPRLSGRTLRLAGRLDDAIADLGPAARSCLALTAPTADILASYELALALDAKADKPGACEALRRVTDLWGGTKAAPLTLKRANKKLASLGCKRPR